MQPQEQAAPPMAPPRGAPFPSFTGEPRATVRPWLGMPPTPGFWAALAAAQRSNPIMERTEKLGGASKTLYSPVENWIKMGRKVLADVGLVPTQIGGIIEDHALGPVLVCEFLLVNAADGTGTISTIAWPVYGFMGGKGSPSQANASAFTSPWKCWLRGILAIAQVDEGEDFEAREPAGNDRGNANGAAQQGRREPLYQEPPEHVQRPYPGMQHGGQPQREGPREQPRNLYPQGSPYPAEQGRMAPSQYPQQQPQYPQPQQPYGNDLGADFQGHDQRPQQRQPSREEWVRNEAAAMQQGQGPRVALNTETGQRVPVQQERIVQHAQQAFGSEQAPAPNSQPPMRILPADGGPDHSLKELLDAGWQETFARLVAGLAVNDEIPGEVRDEFLNAVNEFFGGDLAAAFAAWAGTGFTPQGANGPKPTGAQLRRYMKKMNWTPRTAPAAGK